jgi:hypothetical protein
MHRGIVVGAPLQDGDRAELPRRRVYLHVIILPPAPFAELHGALAAVAPQPAELAAAAPAGEVLPAQHPPHGPAAEHLAQRGPEAAGPPLLEPVVAEAEETVAAAADAASGPG